jgi:hypothetical protein
MACTAISPSCALHEIGMRLDKIQHIMAGARRLSVADIDTAIELKAAQYADEVNERRRMNLNKFKLDASETFTISQAMEELFPTHKRVRLKNDIAAAGLLD